MADFGSRIKNKEKSLAGATNHPAGAGNASLYDWFHFLNSNDKKPPSHWWFFIVRDGDPANTNTLFLYRWSS